MDRISREGGEANPVQSTLLRWQPHKNDTNKGEKGEAGEGRRRADQEGIEYQQIWDRIQGPD